MTAHPPYQQCRTALHPKVGEKGLLKGNPALTFFVPPNSAIEETSGEASILPILTFRRTPVSTYYAYNVTSDSEVFMKHVLSDESEHEYSEHLEHGHHEQSASPCHEKSHKPNFPRTPPNYEPCNGSRKLEMPRGPPYRESTGRCHSAHTFYNRITPFDCSTIQKLQPRTVALHLITNMLKPVMSTHFSSSLTLSSTGSETISDSDRERERCANVMTATPAPHSSPVSSPSTHPTSLLFESNSSGLISDDCASLTKPTSYAVSNHEPSHLLAAHRASMKAHPAHVPLSS
ncbi:hypothetical protein EW146_g10130 [Bondarzewia mesenterica]|uniref:Uncharacterized protein n=1 Tax=Bondarzewia mesenterica TaxID=1095465 RepID=A0A4V3XC66_9AGAM|nr:hypothetical protein EW146_g10130 [Bondarzewia mesenterica]